MTFPLDNPWTEAHQAVEDGDVQELARLLDGGADPDEVCSTMTLLAHAVDHEADTAIQGDREMGVVLIAVLLAYGASPTLRGPEGHSALDTAAEYGHGMAKRLLLRFT
ncbi:ankyrin repeat domain-containing protein [Streptomyces sp. DSM 42041]|uniref:Ankyrin repeat domain-containing protein n=1 Tax=Streptomyces hazeniae TaxID=3075538 RepID=A0ABU2NYC3_9ACTN|nr:ankyrin repeat domain-containing protein [Streptomyces sp. DSM 42041]MDT0380628.1 ankyrin repeat domain-containing protein [Streptomyces sp. DSM 42041]